MIKGGYQIIDLSKITVKFPSESSPPITSYDVSYLYDALITNKVKLFSGFNFINRNDNLVHWEDFFAELTEMGDNFKVYHFHFESNHTAGEPVSKKVLRFTFNHQNKTCILTLESLF